MDKLMNVKVREVDYQYIDYNNKEDRSTSVDGLIIPVNEDTRESLLDVGGFYRDLLTPLRDDESNEIKRIVVLGTTEEGMSQLTGFFFDDGNEDMKVSWTNEPRIANYYKSHVTKKDLPFESINTLEFLANLDDNDSQKYFAMLDHYYNPVAPHDTGIVIDGEIVPYGATVIINNFKTLIEKYPSLQSSPLAKMNVERIDLEINDDGPSMMGIIGSGVMYNEEGRVITTIEDYYHRYVNNGENENVKPYEEFLIEYEKEEIHNLALLIERRLRGRNDKEKVIKYYSDNFDKEKEELHEPAPELMGMSLLLSSIREGIVRVK